MSEPIPSIDAADLAEVTGGASSTDSSTVSGALTSLESSIKSIAKNNNNTGTNSIAQLLPFLVMRGAGGRACPCGCGMANCMRR